MTISHDVAEATLWFQHHELNLTFQ